MARENDDITLLTNPSPLPFAEEKGYVARERDSEAIENTDHKKAKQHVL